MYYNGYITYNNKKSNSSDLKLIMTAPPLFTHSEIRHDTFVIPGRDGELFSKDTYRGNASVKVSFDLATTGAATNYAATINKVYSWLSGTGTLSISDEEYNYSTNPIGFEYEVKKVNIITDQRDIVNYGHIEAEFIVYPYKFVKEIYPNTDNLSIENKYDDCYPLYFLNRASTGSAATFTFTVNGNSMSVEVPSDASAVYVDTRRQIAYYENVNVRHEVKTTGDYRKMKLPGHYTSTLTKSGFSTLTTTPRWGYKI